MRRLAPILTIALLASAAPARAHLGSTKYIRAALEGDAVTLDMSVESVDAAVGLELGEDTPPDAVATHGADIAAWLLGGVSVRRGDDACEGAADAPERETRDERPFFRVRLRFTCPGEGAITLTDDTVFPTDRQHEALVYIAGRGDDDGNRGSADVLRWGSRSLRLDTPPPSLGELALTFLYEGAIHFATGYDHVLFLLSLILGVGWTLRDEGRRAAAKDLAWLVTAFTVGHSVTLALAALEVVVLPSQPVEVLIALSIVLVAAYAFARPRARAPLPYVAGIFGLIHGFGFSSVLGEIGLPPSGAVVALLCFNVGIELAQLAFVAVALAPLGVMARSERYGAVVKVSSALIALLAMYWVVTRL